MFFLSAWMLIGKAQDEFFRLDGWGIGDSFQSSLSRLSNLMSFDHRMGGDITDDIDIHKMVHSLQNHIKQWSFIEAQLLEPNVNLDMVSYIVLRINFLFF